MELVDRLAAMAMQAILPSALRDAADSAAASQYVAEQSYEVARAMIAERRTRGLPSSNEAN